MAPELESDTDIKQLYFCKFLREGDVIIYDVLEKEHSRIAREHKFNIKVDDGGYITPTKFISSDLPRKIIFSSTTTTCEIRGDKEKQRIITTNVAKKILGEDKVEG